MLSQKTLEQNSFLECQHCAKQDFPDVGANYKGGANLLVPKISQKNCIKMKKLGRGACPKFYYVDPPLA